jgi:hypothetical protein
MLDLKFSRRVASLELTDVSEMRTSSTITLMIEVVRTSEIPFYYNEATRRYIAEGSHLHFHSKLFNIHYKSDHFLTKHCTSVRH